PSSRAISAITGAAPVPVPPPMPAVMKTRSAPSIARRTSSRDSSIACRPISGRAPAPRPRVSFLPIWVLRCDFEFFSACASVFTLMNSTPSRSSSIMRFTALPPPPPTPTTFMRAFWTAPSSNSKIIMVHPPLGVWRRDNARAARVERPKPPPRELEELLQPCDQPTHGGLAEARAATTFELLRGGEQHQPGRRRVARLPDALHQAGHPCAGDADPRRRAE